MANRKTKTRKFKKGEIYHLDEIYAIDGLCGGDWWEPKDESGEIIQITRDITIQINWWD
jgi:hypothetical protein